MDRVRIRDEVIEILCAKLPNLLPPVEDPDFDATASLSLRSPTTISTLPRLAWISKMPLASL